MMDDNDILFSQVGHIGLVTLNRPRALNAITLLMIVQLQKQLELWKDDNGIHAIVICAELENVFCAGGDVRWLYNEAEKDDSEQMLFFWHEYRLNHFIHKLSKPYIALMNGITMGGGVGISMHGSHPVASEHFVFAMPETSIGFFPDIGASHLLTACPGYLGMYLGLTGNRLGAHDALRAGLVSHVVAADQMSAVLDDLIAADLSKDAHSRVNECLQSYALPRPANDATQIKPLIDHCFAKPGVEDICRALQNEEGAWAAGVEETLHKKSPLALQVTFAQLQKAKGLSLAECLQMDFDLVAHFMRGSDFYEGVRAMLIDKDKNPHWHPARLSDVSDDEVVNYFEPSNSRLELIVP